MNTQKLREIPALPCQECGGNGAGGKHEDDCTKQQTILNLSEAARSLGVAQAKDDQDAIDYWGAEVTRYEREARQPMPDVAGLQAELARELQRRFDGNEQASREHREDMKVLVEALEQIVAIELQDFGADWEEIEEAQQIASDALAAYRKGG